MKSIMRTYIKILLVIAATFSAVSCEKDWEKYETENLEMNLFILAEADSTIRGWVMPVLDYFSEFTGRFFESTSSSITITNAISAMYSVNDGEKIRLEKNKAQTDFIAKPVLKAGDKVNLEMTGYYYNPVKASVVIPDKPQIEYENLGLEKIDDGEYFMLKVKIKDNGAKKNYYMVSVFSSAVDSVYVYYRNDNKLYGSFRWSATSSVFTSKDVIFKDDQVKRKPKGMPNDFSNVFSDKSFNGKDYEFIIGCPINLGTSIISNTELYSVVKSIENQVTFSLCELTEEYYNYYKMYEHTDKSNGVVYFSNVDGGFGLFGALNRTKPVTFKYNKTN